MTETMAETGAQGLFAEEDARAEEERQRRIEEKKLNSAFAGVMQTVSGRKAMAWILSLTGEKDSVTSLEPMRMMLQSARRDVGLQIRARLQAAGLGEQIYLMQEENDGRRGN